MQESAILKKIVVTASETGVDAMTAKVENLAKSETELTKAEKERASVEAAIARQRVEFNRIAAQQVAVMQDFNASAKLMAAANDNVSQSSSHLSDVLRVATKTAVDHVASWAATAGAVGAGVLIFGSLLAVLGPIIIAYKVVKEVVTLAAEAWELGGKKLEEFRKIAEKAAAVDLATDYFQRITKAAADAKLPVDDLTAAFKKLNSESTERLGGSSLQTKLDALREAGNFKGNSGVDQLAAANTAEQKFRAVVSLIDQAMQKGERLAAIDLAGTVLGPTIAENLRKDSEYLNKMQASADKLAATEIVSAADVGRALELQQRYDAAVKILETRWHPIQDLLTQAGLKMQSAWVGIVEAVAQAVDWVTKLVLKIAEIPQTFWDYIKKGAGAAASVAVGAVPVVGPALSIGARLAGNAMADAPPVAATTAYSEAINKLRAGLQNTSAVQQQVNEAMTVANKVYGDSSKTLGGKATPAVVAQKDALARAIDGVEKYILTTDAAAKSVDAGVAEQTKAKVIADLTAAAMRDGKTNLEQYASAWDELGTRAGKAAQELALARVQSQIKFDRETAFLSQEDVQIAQQLKGLFPDVATALKSPQAEAMRLNNTLQLVKSSAENFASGFARDLMNGVPAIKALENGLKNLASSLIDNAVKKLVDEALSGVAGALGGAAAGAGQAATMTAGATTAAGLLTTAGTTVAASIIAGAMEAAAILGLTVPTAAATLPVAGAVTGTEVAAGGVAAGASLAAGGAAAGSALWGPIAILVAAVAALGAASLFGGGDDDELRKAQDNWRGMAGQLKEFNRAADGFDLGPLTQELESLRQAHDTLAMAALEARDYAGLNAVHETLNRGIQRVFSEWMNGVPVLGELSQKIQDLTNEARGLAEAIPDAAAAIDQGLIARINALKMAAEDSLKSEINVASGFGWLNDVNAAIAKFNDLNGKVDAGTLNTWMTVTLQKIVDDAQLTGEAFQRLITGIPQIAGYIHEYSEALDESGQAALAAAAAQEKANLQLRLLVAQTDQTTLSGALAVNALKQQMEMNDAIAANSQNIVLLEQVHAAERLNIVQDFADRATKAAQDAADRQAQILKDAQATFEGFVRNIRDFIAHYLAGPESGLSPADQLANAQAAFNSQIVLAQGGDRDALNSITQYFSDLDKASKAFYASSSAGQAITGAALSQLEALPSQISPEQFIVNAIEATSVDQITAIQAMQTALSGVLTVGNPSANAAALLPFFQALNTTVDAGLTLTELITGLGATYNTGTLRNIFAELDGNGNGILEKSELIKLATQGTETGVDQVDINTDSLPVQATRIAGMDTSLLAMAQVSNNTASTANGIATLALLLGGSSTSVGEAARAMRLMMQVQNQNWGREAGASGVNIGTFEKGGFTGYGSGIVGGVHEQEFVLKRAATASIGLPALNYMNDNARMPSFGGSDNRELIAEIKRLNAKVDRLTAVNAAGHEGAIEAAHEGNHIARKTADARRLQRSRTA